MSNSYIIPAFRAMYDIDFDKNSLEHRTLMQIGIYLLQELGANITNYGFLITQNVVFSHALSNDAIKHNGISVPVPFSENTISQIEKIRDIFTRKDVTMDAYSSVNWMACLSIAVVSLQTTPALTLDAFHRIVAPEPYKFDKPHCNEILFHTALLFAGKTNVSVDDFANLKQLLSM